MDIKKIGNFINFLRNKKGLTQEQLARKINVTNKAISKWERGVGLPDISLLEPLSAALGVSIIELMSGKQVVNFNKAANMLRTKFYICPICGNVIHTIGESLVSCCGIRLPLLDAEEPDEQHCISIEEVENEHFITVNHPMTKTHFISFVAYVTPDRFQMVKLYPEGNPCCRLQLQRTGYLYFYCNHHGLIKKKL